MAFSGKVRDLRDGPLAERLFDELRVANIFPHQFGLSHSSARKFILSVGQTIEHRKHSETAFSLICGRISSDETGGAGDKRKPKISPCAAHATA